MQLITSDNRPQRIKFSKMKVPIHPNEKAFLIASITFNRHYRWRAMINNCFKIARVYTFQSLKCLNGRVRGIKNRAKFKYSAFYTQTYCAKSIQSTHQQMHHLLNLEKFKICITIHTNIPPTCFGLRPSSGSWY